MAKKKKYSQSKADRMDEAMAMKRANGKGNMQFNRGELPEEVRMKEYPKMDYIKTDVPDDMYAMDELANNAVRKAQRHLARKPY